MQHLKVKDSNNQMSVEINDSWNSPAKKAVHIPTHPSIVDMKLANPTINGPYFIAINDNLYSVKLIDLSSIISYFNVMPDT